MEYEEAKRKTKETLHPLKVELADLEDQVRFPTCFNFSKTDLFFFRRLLSKLQEYLLQRQPMPRTMKRYSKF